MECGVVWVFIIASIVMRLAGICLLSPIMAAGAMVVSGLLVIGNSLRLGISRDDKSPATETPVVATAANV